MSFSLSASECPLSKIFCDDYAFSIPGYQRPYSWTLEQARELYEDLTGQLNDDPREVSELPLYFLGSIVLIKEEGKPHAEVVDGQQRLTTLTILLAALRACLPEASRRSITSLLYEEGNEFTGSENRFRLTVRARDQEFFERAVQRPGGIEDLIESKASLTDSRRNMRENARFFYGVLSELSTDELLRLGKFITQRCILVVVATPDFEAAYRIFSVLNSRGLDLTGTDILKAQLLGKISERDREDYTEIWEEAEDRLGRDEFDDLFSHIRMVYCQRRPKSDPLWA